MATDAEIQAMANKYGWDDAKIADLKRMRDQMPGRDVEPQPSPQLQASANVAPMNLNPTSVQQLQQGMQTQGMANGGVVPNAMPPQAPIQPAQQQLQTQPMSQMDQQKQMQMDALKKLRGF